MRVGPAQWVCFGSLLFLALQWPISASAAAATDEPVTASEKQDQEQVEDQDKAADTDTKKQEADSILDRQKRFMDTQVQRASRWVDGFFANSQYQTESDNNQLRVRPEFDYRDQQGADVKLNMHAKIQLPRFGKRVRLVAGTKEKERWPGEFEDDSNDNTLVGLQFFLSESQKWHTSFDTGVKYGSLAFFTGPRVRYQTPVNDRTSFRFTQTLHWQTNNYWDIGSRGDLDFVLRDGLYFRQTVFSHWRGEKSDYEGLHTRVSSILSQRLSGTAGLQYEFSTILLTRPDRHVDEYWVSLRFRKRTEREWLYYEIAPEVAFEDMYGFKANPGIRFTLEIYYGGKGPSQY